MGWIQAINQHAQIHLESTLSWGANHIKSIFFGRWIKLLMCILCLQQFSDDDAGRFGVAVSYNDSNFLVFYHFHQTQNYWIQFIIKHQNIKTGEFFYVDSKTNMSVVPTNQHYILLVSQNEKLNLPWILELFWSLSSVTKLLISDGSTSLIVPYWLKTGSLDLFPLLQTNNSYKIHDMTKFGHVISAFLSKRSGVFAALTTTTTIINPNNVKSVQTMKKKK